MPLGAGKAKNAFEALYFARFQIQPEQAPIERANPHVAEAVRKKGTDADTLVLQVGLERVAMRPVAGQPTQEVFHHPHITEVVSFDVIDRRGVVAIRVLGVVGIGLHSLPVIATQSPPGTKPHETGSILVNGLDLGVGQSVLQAELVKYEVLLCKGLADQDTANYEGTNMPDGVFQDRLMIYFAMPKIKEKIWPAGNGFSADL